MTKEKNKTTKLVVSIILAILVAIAGVVTGVLLFKLAILPVQLTIGAMIALIIIGVLALVLVLRRKRGWVFGIVLSVIYLLCCGSSTSVSMEIVMIARTSSMVFS